ncbi:YciI family protein [Amorphus sp. MBR-141]
MKSARKTSAPKAAPEDAFARLKGMINHDVVVIESLPRPGFQVGPLLSEHLDFMIDLEKRGLLFLSGPTIEADGAIGQVGLTVLNVQTLEKAREIWSEEPFFKAGQRDAEFRLWRLMEGALNLTISLSDIKVGIVRST